MIARVMEHNPPLLQISKSSSANVVRLDEGSWHLEIPASKNRDYRLAQLDDHGSHQRRNFHWQPPFTLSLQARVSAEDIPGTWGFGLWNDPFSFMFAYNKLVPRLPTLPEASWFFHASFHNYLSLLDNLPANGFLAATFSSSRLPIAFLAAASPILALTLIPGAAQRVRRLLRRVVKQDTKQIDLPLTEWHSYQMNWIADQVSFKVDEVGLFQTHIAPHSPLSLVIWIDNQYAALPPKGGFKYGTLPNPAPAWLEIRDVCLAEQA